MSMSITIAEAQERLDEIIRQLTPGQEIIIVDNEQPVARLISEPAMPPLKRRPGPGLCKGMITYIAPDFDAPLEDMKEYMG